MKATSPRLIKTIKMFKKKKRAKYDGRTYINTYAMDIAIQNRCHLSLLNISYFPFREHNEAIHIFLSS